VNTNGRPSGLAKQMGGPKRPMEINAASALPGRNETPNPTRISLSLLHTEKRKAAPVPSNQPRRRGWPVRRSKRVRASIRAAPSNSPGRVARVAENAGELTCKSSPSSTTPSPATQMDAAAARSGRAPGGDLHRRTHVFITS
jgi:hypothetical protein